MTTDDRFYAYWRYIKQCVDGVISELSLGNTDSLEVLHQHIERITEILTSSEAFELVNSQSPYEWKELIDIEVITRHDFDFGKIALEIANGIAYRDTLHKISQMDCFRYLSGEKRRLSLVLPTGTKVVFKEVWLADASALDYLPPIKIEAYKEKELTFYQEGGTPIITLSHDDPALSWISEKILPKPDLSIDEFERIKVETLLRFGFPENRLWLTEVQSASTSFNRFYQDQTSPESPETYYGLEDFHYVIYFHESGEIHCHTGFNSMEDFTKACLFLAKHVA